MISIHRLRHTHTSLFIKGTKRLRAQEKLAKATPESRPHRKHLKSNPTKPQLRHGAISVQKAWDDSPIDNRWELTMTNTSSMASQQAWRIARALGRELVSQRANAVWSPACVASLLAVAREGASGTTRRELDALLGADGCPGIGNFLEKDDPFGLKPLGSWGYEDYAASMAVATWISNATSPSDAFLRKCADCSVHASIADLGDPQVGREVSDWISEQTRGLLSPSVELSPLTLVCLVSALYLKDAWEDPFYKDETEAGAFHAPDGDTQVAYMNGICSSKVLEKSGFTAFELGLSRAPPCSSPSQTATSASLKTHSPSLSSSLEGKATRRTSTSAFHDSYARQPYQTWIRS